MDDDCVCFLKFKLDYQTKISKISERVGTYKGELIINNIFI